MKSSFYQHKDHISTFAHRRRSVLVGRDGCAGENGDLPIRAGKADTLISWAFQYLLVMLLVCLPAAVASAGSVTTLVTPGLNVTAVTAVLVSGQQTAFTLLAQWKPLGVIAIESYDVANVKMLRAELDGSGNPAGADFPLVENSALYVYSTQQNTLALGASASCASLNLASGFNLAGFACFPSGYQASEFLNSVGLSKISSLSRLDTLSGRWMTAAVDSGTIVGDDFPLVAGEGYVIQTTGAAVWTSPQPVITSMAPSVLATFDTPGNIAVSGSQFKADSVVMINGTAVLTTFVNSTLLNAAIPLQSVPTILTVQVKNPDSLHAGGYFISDTASLSVVSSALALSPASLTVLQGQPGAALTVTIPEVAPTGGTVVGLVSSDPTLVGVPALVTVPQGSATAAVPLSLPDTGVSAVQTVTVTASRSGMTSPQSIITVHPKPTINLSPLTTLTGLTFTYLLTVNLTDVAPPGGFPVTLSASPAGIATLPASVTIPAGANSTQVTVTATAVGNATISATSPGRGYSGAQNAVTVTPIQTMNYGPVLTPQIGVAVTVPQSSSGLNVLYGPVISGQVGVTVGSVVTGIVPSTGAIGTTGMKVTVTGVGLASATAISFQPAAGITVKPGTFAINAGGNPEVFIDIDPTAPTIKRTVIVTLPSRVPAPSVPGANQFLVTLPEPQILSIQPIRAMTGQMVPLNVFGKNLTAATSINFTPSAGIAVSNPPTVSAAGDVATVTVSIDANAPLGNRVVTITTPGWTSTTTPSVANTFQITADAGTTYASLVSRQVGVVIQPQAVASSQSVMYGPVTSGQVGVVVGSAISGIVPPTGATGSTNLKVTVTGAGLSNATAIAFQPATGITVHPGSFAITNGNPEVTIDIDAAAPTITRTVIVTTPSGSIMPAAPGASQFRVTLPEPHILSMQPIRAMVGQLVVLNIFGNNLASASSIDFTPATGISVNNPPIIDSSGTMATVTVGIAANAPLGNRIVTISTPGWTSSATPSVANTFQVTADAGTTYTSLVSRGVGVLVQVPVAAASNITYGPVVSTGVGVMVTPIAAPATQNVAYSPIVSTQVGVAVGSVLSGIAPLTVEPGSTTTVTLTGIGLKLANAIQVIPATGITVGTWTPAADGLSGTVLITADATTPVGQKSIVALTANGSITPAVPSANTLLVGYRPAINSISPILPTVGTTFTLTVNGLHLQGATKIEILPATNVVIDYPPVWTNDGTGEHLTVKVIIDSTATPGDRVVIVTTPYGVTTMVGSVANTITFFKPGTTGASLNHPAKPRVAVAQAMVIHCKPDELLPVYFGREYALVSQHEKATVRIAEKMAYRFAECTQASARETSRAAAAGANGYQYAGYRGPPRSESRIS